MTKNDTFSDDVIIDKIHLIRGQKVIVDQHLAELYHVEVNQLRRAVRKNSALFAEDFVFELGKDEVETLVTRIGSPGWGSVKYAPMAFTEQGIAALSGILNNGRVVLVNMHIMRVFMRMRENGG